MVIRKSVIGLALISALALAASSAGAADIYAGPAGGYKDTPYAPVAIWTGFYAGLNGGYAFDAQGTHGGVQDNGGFGGGQIGYNWQGGFGLNRNLVLGLEADFEGAGIDSSGTTTLYPAGVAAQHDISIDFLGTVRGRIGYAWGPALAYFTGGFAYGDVKNQFDTVTGKFYKSDAMEAGYTLGGGVEYKINPAWSLKAEYQYIDLGHEDATGASGYVATKDTEINTIRGGINYHVGPSYLPLK